jgi:hypothetical protein
MRPDRLSARLIGAFSAGTCIDDLPAEEMVMSPDEVYQVQAVLARKLGPVIGWKVTAKGHPRFAHR